MASKSTKKGASFGLFEPELVHTFLPGCACGGLHPLARKPQMPADTCPDCNAPVARTHSVRVGAVLTGWRPDVLVARACLSLGRFFAALAKKV